MDERSAKNGSKTAGSLTEEVELENTQTVSLTGNAGEVINNEERSALYDSHLHTRPSVTSTTSSSVGNVQMKLGRKMLKGRGDGLLGKLSSLRYWFFDFFTLIGINQSKKFIRTIVPFFEIWFMIQAFLTSFDRTYSTVEDNRGVLDVVFLVIRGVSDPTAIYSWIGNEIGYYIHIAVSVIVSLCLFTFISWLFIVNYSKLNQMKTVAISLKTFSSFLLIPVLRIFTCMFRIDYAAATWVPYIATAGIGSKTLLHVPVLYLLVQAALNVGLIVVIVVVSEVFLPTRLHSINAVTASSNIYFSCFNKLYFIFAVVIIDLAHKTQYDPFYAVLVGSCAILLVVSIRMHVYYRRTFTVFMTIIHSMCLQGYLYLLLSNRILDNPMFLLVFVALPVFLFVSLGALFAKYILFAVMFGRKKQDIEEEEDRILMKKPFRNFFVLYFPSDVAVVSYWYPEKKFLASYENMLVSKYKSYSLLRLAEEIEVTSLGVSKTLIGNLFNFHNVTSSDFVRDYQYFYYLKWVNARNQLGDHANLEIWKSTKYRSYREFGTIAMLESKLGFDLCKFWKTLSKNEMTPSRYNKLFPLITSIDSSITELENRYQTVMEISGSSAGTLKKYGNFLKSFLRQVEMGKLYLEKAQEIEKSKGTMHDSSAADSDFPKEESSSKNSKSTGLEYLRQKIHKKGRFLSIASVIVYAVIILITFVSAALVGMFIMSFVKGESDSQQMSEYSLFSEKLADIGIYMRKMHFNVSGYNHTLGESYTRYRLRDALETCEELFHKIRHSYPVEVIDVWRNFKIERRPHDMFNHEELSLFDSLGKYFSITRELLKFSDEELVDETIALDPGFGYVTMYSFEVFHAVEDFFLDLFKVSERFTDAYSIIGAGIVVATTAITFVLLMIVYVAMSVSFNKLVKALRIIFPEDANKVYRKFLRRKDNHSNSSVSRSLGMTSVSKFFWASIFVTVVAFLFTGFVSAVIIYMTRMYHSYYSQLYIYTHLTTDIQIAYSFTSELEHFEHSNGLVPLEETL